MKIVFVCFATPGVGLGHWYRTIALANAAKEAGHFAWICGNRMARGYNYYQIRENEPDDLLHIIHQIKPDYLVLDLQDRVPSFIYDLPRDKMKIVVLNGVGRQEEDKADLTVIQGLSTIQRQNTYSGIEYVILRPSLFKYPRVENPRSWFVFGGAADKMGLLSTFQSAMPEETANLWLTSFSANGNLKTTEKQIVFRSDGFGKTGDEMLAIMSITKSACIAMGMTAWELIALGIPAYVFSWSDGHLKFAKQMEDHGLLKAWNGVGVPSADEMKLFLSEPFEITGQKPDEFGAQRVLELLEKNL